MPPTRAPSSTGLLACCPRVDVTDARQVSIHPEIDSVPAAAWDALANPPGAESNPFVSHAFLHALEASGSATPE